MKKHIVFLALSVLLLSSCETLTKTARVADSSLSIQSATVADLKVSEHRVTHTMTPSKEVLRGGLDNVKQAVEQEALINNGNADILVSSRPRQYKVLAQWKLKYRPHECNCSHPEDGFGLYVYDLHSKEQSNLKSTQQTRTSYDVRSITWKKLLNVGTERFKLSLKSKVSK